MRLGLAALLAGCTGGSSGARDATEGDATETDAGILRFDPCVPAPAHVVVPPSPAQLQGWNVMSDADGWLVLWSLVSAVPKEAGLFAAREGGLPVRLGEEGGQVAGAQVSGGALVCWWPYPVPDPSAPGRCLTVDGDLVVTSGPATVPYGPALSFPELDGRLYALSVGAFDFSAAHYPLELTEIDGSGTPLGVSVRLPCSGALSWASPPASNGSLLVCLELDDRICDAGTCVPCTFRVRRVAADGSIVGSDVPVPNAAPLAFGCGGASYSVGIAAQSDGFLVTWVSDDGVHAQAFGTDGTLGIETTVPTQGPWSSSVTAIGAGYAVVWSPFYDATYRLPRVAVFAHDGTLLARPDWVAEPPGPVWQGNAIGVSRGDGWALGWLGREDRGATTTVHFRAFGCDLAGGDCGPGLSRCVDDDGVARCVDTSCESCHCGACGNRCGACSAGACADCGPGRVACGPPVPCLSGAGVCIDWCADLSNDARNCGACGTQCAPGQVCVDGACCAAAEIDCHNGVDDDCDGFTDCWEDCDCLLSWGGCGAWDCFAEICINGFDDDLDDLIDCADPDCALDTACGGPGRCPQASLGTTYPLARMFPCEIADEGGAGSCGGPGHGVGHLWTAPVAGTFTIDAQGPERVAALYVRDGACDGPELACASGPAPSADVTLAAGQTVVIVADGPSWCYQLRIR